MDKLCTRCLALRCIGFRKLLSNTIKRTIIVNRREEKIVLPNLNFAKQYVTAERTSELTYEHGKLVTEVVEDPTLYPHFLMIFTGYDEAVLETYFNFAKKAAQIVDVSLANSFNMPAKEEIHQSQIAKGDVRNQVKYTLKKYQRVLEVGNLTGEKNDIYIEYLQKSLPAGVEITMQLKQWEMHVDPDHISLRNLKS